jgi:hypothetical protein
LPNLRVRKDATVLPVTKRHRAFIKVHANQFPRCVAPRVQSLWV